MLHERKNLICGLFAVGCLLICRLAVLLCCRSISVFDTDIAYTALFEKVLESLVGIWIVAGATLVSLIVLHRYQSLRMARQVAFIAYCILVLLSLAYIVMVFAETLTTLFGNMVLRSG